MVYSPRHCRSAACVSCRNRMVHDSDGVGAAVRELAGGAEWSQVQRSALLSAAEYGGRGIPKGALIKGQQSKCLFM